MSISRNKLYTLLFTACTAGYVWLFFSNSNTKLESEGVDVCLIKHLTNIPCPSCGSTRSVLAFMQGNFSEALQTNPMGIIILLILLITPVWIFLDIIFRKKTLWNFYYQAEQYLKKPKIAFPLVALVLCNWIWNILKGL